MPVIGIPVSMLLERIKTPLKRPQLVEHLQHLGCDVEGYATMRRYRCVPCGNILEITETENPPVVCDRCGADFRAREEQLRYLGTADVIRMELLAVRPDMFDPGGLARVLRNYLSETLEPATYQVEASHYRVTVDPYLATEGCLRPWIACAVVRNFSLDDDRIKVVMKLQENLHWALGRDRKHASIGVYDLDQLDGQHFRYFAVEPETHPFVPLGGIVSDLASRKTPAQILSDHPKGKQYARLLSTFRKVPLLVDEKENVLSMPPIINSEPTRVTESTRNFFIDVTGSEERIVNKTLNTIVTSLLELDRNAQLESVVIEYEKQKRCTPDLTPQQVEIDPESVGKTIGVSLSRNEVVDHLKRMGHAVAEQSQALRVAVPAYRNDIMHPIDLIEDVAIAYGYHRIVPALVPTMTTGSELSLEKEANLLRRCLTGLGYFEVMTLILSSETWQFDALRLPRNTNYVLIENPISPEQTMIRTSLIPGILDTFSVNTDHEMPQRIFEIGNVSQLDATTQTGARELRQLAVAATGPKIDFAELRSVCDACVHELGWRLVVEATPCELFIPGRSGSLFAHRGEQRIALGRIGEIHPEVLERFGLVQPVTLYEINVETLISS